MNAFIRALATLVAVGALVGGILAYSVARGGLSTRADPSAAEAFVARTMRRVATPSVVRNRANPVLPTAEVFEEALRHYADHCATCHANDGSGNTALGRNMYPKAPDMRTEATQSLSDGELFAIIENGIRLTGMPAWGDGTPEGERASWALVHFVRRLSTLTPEDIERMEALNPKTAAEFREEEEAKRFLAGDDGAAGAGAAPPAAHEH